MVRVGDFEKLAVIVGAPRCGTTTLAHFLKEHDEVCFPLVKEPHFFSQHDLRALRGTELRSHVEQHYLNRFFTCRPGARVAADASVTYFYAPEQLEPILRLWPQSRFVVALRNPLAMLPSLHRRLLYLGDETIPRFRDAWRAVSDRAAGRRLPRRCADPRWLRYDLAAQFTGNLKRLFSTVGRDRCHVVIFDDLVADTAGQYEQFMSFLGLTPMPQPDLSPKRSGKSVRIGWLQRLLKRPPHRLREYLAGEHYRRRVCQPEAANMAKAPNAILSLRKRLLKWNRVSRPLEPIPSDLQTEICAHFSDDIEHLSELIGRDLRHWLHVPQHRPPHLQTSSLFQQTAKHAEPARLIVSNQIRRVR